MAQLEFRPDLLKLVDARILAMEIREPENGSFLSREMITGLGFHIESKSKTIFAQNLLQISLLIGVNASYRPSPETAEKQFKEAGKFKLSFTYEVQNLPEMSTKQDESYLIDSTLSRHLLGISYSTARGMILTKTGGTYLAGAILPIMDPTNILGASA